MSRRREVTFVGKGKKIVFTVTVLKLQLSFAAFSLGVIAGDTFEFELI